VIRRWSRHFLRRVPMKRSGTAFALVCPANSGHLLWV
jgi:hypothetical protein